MKVESEPGDYPTRTAPTITVHALKSNKRPIGFAPWPDPPKKKPRAKAKPRAKREPS